MDEECVESVTPLNEVLSAKYEKLVVPLNSQCRIEELWIFIKLTILVFEAH